MREVGYPSSSCRPLSSPSLSSPSPAPLSPRISSHGFIWTCSPAPSSFSISTPVLSREPLFLGAALGIQKAADSKKKFKPSVHSAHPDGILTSADELPVGDLGGEQAANIRGLGPGCMHRNPRAHFPGCKCHEYTGPPWLSGNRQSSFGRFYITDPINHRQRYQGEGQHRTGTDSLTTIPSMAFTCISNYKPPGN